MSDPTTVAGRALLEAFTARAIDAPDAIHLNAESIIRHAIPRIEAEAYERGAVAGMAMERYTAPPSDPAAPLDVERLSRAVDAHNEEEEPFSPVHCNSGDDCHVAIAREYAALATPAPASVRDVLDTARCSICEDPS